MKAVMAPVVVQAASTRPTIVITRLPLWFWLRPPAVRIGFAPAGVLGPRRPARALLGQTGLFLVGVGVAPLRRAPLPHLRAHPRPVPPQKVHRASVPATWRFSHPAAVYPW